MKNIKPKKEEVFNYITINLDQELTNNQFQTSIKHITESGILINDSDGYDVHIGLWHVYVEILQYNDLNNTKENLKIVETRIKTLEDKVKNKKL